MSPHSFIVCCLATCVPILTPIRQTSSGQSFNYETMYAASVEPIKLPRQIAITRLKDSTSEFQVAKLVAGCPPTSLLQSCLKIIQNRTNRLNPEVAKMPRCRLLSKIVGPTPPTLPIITSSIGANMTRGILKMVMSLMILIATDMQKAANLVNKFVLFFPNLCLFLAKICFFTLILSKLHKSWEFLCQLYAFKAFFVLFFQAESTFAPIHVAYSLFACLYSHDDYDDDDCSIGAQYDLPTPPTHPHPIRGTETSKLA